MQHYNPRPQAMNNFFGKKTKFYKTGHKKRQYTKRVLITLQNAWNFKCDTNNWAFTIRKKRPFQRITLPLVTIVTIGYSSSLPID